MIKDSPSLMAGDASPKHDLKPWSSGTRPSSTSSTICSAVAVHCRHLSALLSPTSEFMDKGMSGGGCAIGGRERVGESAFNLGNSSKAEEGLKSIGSKSLDSLMAEKKQWEEIPEK